jgi:hypothetical protein
MTPNEMLARMRSIGIGFDRLNSHGHPAGVLPGDGSLAVVQPASDGGPDDPMAEPLRLSSYVKDGSGDGKKREQKPADSYPELTAAEVIDELIRHM